ncbi:MAG: endonuclease/exonuclease/phosphatase family protein [Vibrio sp.]
MDTFSLVLTFFVVIVTLLPFSRHPHWSVRGLDFPRLQFACLALFVLVLNLWDLSEGALQPSWLNWLCILASGFCFVWQSWWILPYTPFWKKEVKTSRDDGDASLKIITANVLKFNRKTERLIGFVRSYQPDVLVVLESDDWWETKLDALQEQMPYSLKQPLDNLYGMHVYSRLPLERAQICHLIEDDVPSMHALIVLDSGDKVRAHFMHPRPPSPTENPESAERDAELIMVAKSVAKTSDPVIVTGDLNDVAWSPTTRLFRKISGLLDPRVGRGMFNTFHAKWPLLRWPLDHVFHSPHFTLRCIECLPDIGSDHFALYTELNFHRKPKLEQQGIDADEEEHEWAEQIVAEKNGNEADVPKFSV